MMSLNNTDLLKFKLELFVKFPARLGNNSVKTSLTFSKVYVFILKEEMNQTNIIYSIGAICHLFGELIGKVKYILTVR